MERRIVRPRGEMSAWASRPWQMTTTTFAMEKLTGSRRGVRKEICESAAQILRRIDAIAGTDDGFLNDG